MLVPAAFLVRVSLPCRHHAAMPGTGDEWVVDLPESCRLRPEVSSHGRAPFAELRAAWNDLGLGFHLIVKGKTAAPAGDANRPRQSDGLTVWLDTRDSRTSHRASRFCHQFHFLAAGGGPDGDEPMFAQSKINRASQDAPQVPASAVPFQCELTKGGYVIRAFLPAAALNGYDPEEHPRLGFYFAVADRELGEQFLGVGTEFPFADDPSLWAALELVRASM